MKYYLVVKTYNDEFYSEDITHIAEMFTKKEIMREAVNMFELMQEEGRTFMIVEETAVKLDDVELMYIEEIGEA